MSSSLTSFSNLSKAFYACRRPDVETPRLHVAGENLMKAYYIINWIVSGKPEDEMEKQVRETI